VRTLRWSGRRLIACTLSGPTHFRPQPVARCAVGGGLGGEALEDSPADLDLGLHDRSTSAAASGLGLCANQGQVSSVAGCDFRDTVAARALANDDCVTPSQLSGRPRGAGARLPALFCVDLIYAATMIFAVTHRFVEQAAYEYAVALFRTLDQ
jgi:hypothetical protein